MKNNKEDIAAMQAQKMMLNNSREATPQPLLKFNLGPGNNFIVKNSNILITQNSINKGAINPLFQNNDINASSQGGIINNSAQSRGQMNNHQRAYSFEQKTRIYQGKAPSYNSQIPNGSNIQGQANSGPGSRNKQRFANVVTAFTGNQSNLLNNQNNSFKHQNRKLNYSPILNKSGKVNRKKVVQDEFLKIPVRRAHSKNEKYPLEEGSLIEQEDSVDNPHHYSTHEGHHNFLVQNSFEKQMQQQHFTPMQYGIQNSMIPNQRQDQQDRNGQRPSSATQKRLQGAKRSEDLQSNLRLLLQQNVMQNKENKKLMQSKMAPKSRHSFINKGCIPKQDILNTLLNNSQNQANTALYIQAQNSKPNSRQNIQKGYDLYDNLTKQSLDKAFTSYQSNPKKQQELINSHKRSQSHSNHDQQKKHQTPTVHQNMSVQEESDRVKSRQSHKRPKSNLDIIPSQQKTSTNFYPQQLQAQQIKTTNDKNSISNQAPQVVKLNNDTNQEQKQYTFFTANPQQMYTNCVTKFAFATKTGLAPSNPNKVNQDNWITVPHFCGLKYCHLFATCDGHGQFGREVSTFLKNRLPQCFENEMKYVFLKFQEQNTTNQRDDPLNTDEICIAFNNAFLDTNEELYNGFLDIRFSGSTCVSVMTLGQKLFCSNVGDSRAIIVKKTQEGKIIAQAVSRDQKPNQPDEAERVIKSGGRIDSFRDPEKNPIGPLRVWLKNEDIPGLAMTRAFGDEVAARVGVLAEPEILELDLCKDDKFIVLASDGVWEFIQNEEVANIVLPFYEKRNAEGAAEALVRESYLRWKQEEEDIIDDITCVIVFLDVKLPQQSASPTI